MFYLGCHMSYQVKKGRDEVVCFVCVLCLCTFANPYSLAGCAPVDLNLVYSCNSRPLRSHMRLKKNRPYNHWLKSQGHYLSCFSTSKRSEPIRFACDMRRKTRYSLKATTKITPTLENKNVPILRSQNTQNTRTPLKTGSEQSA